MMTWDLETEDQWRRDDGGDLDGEYRQIRGYVYPREEWELIEKIRLAPDRKDRPRLTEEYERWKEDNPESTASPQKIRR
jgi:hypothetical protein